MTCTLSIGLLCCLSGTLPKPVLGCDCDLSRDVLLRNEYCTAETRNALRSCIALRREGKEDEANQATTQLLARLPLDGVIGGDYWCVRQYQLIQAENRGDFRAVLDGYVDWIAATGSDEIAYWLAERAGKHRRFTCDRRSGRIASPTGRCEAAGCDRCVARRGRAVRSTGGADRA